MEFRPPRLAVGDVGMSDADILAAAFMLAAAALVHLAVAPEHFAEWWPLGVLFAIAAALQSGLAVALVQRPRRALVRWICAVDLAIAGVWLASRTVGLPFSPDAGEAEPAAWLDLLTTFDELVLVLALAIQAGWTASAAGGTVARLCRIVGTAAALLMTLGVAGGVGHA